MTTDSGNWDWSRLTPVLPQYILEQIAPVPPPQTCYGPDTVPQRIRTFLWVTLHQRHLTNAERFRRHLAQSALCPICYLEDEDLDHILRRCLPARNLWNRVVPSDRLAIFLNLPLVTWLRDNLLHRQLNSSFMDGWDCQFAVFCWLLWKDRCTTIFDSESAPTEDILTRGLRLA
ncbi:hypothetical protein V6N11_025520 [Hibiscus sabdariffa]|uniref:Reverse transcriptase zinc-binding domain-containing protein n=1 Tax=Hibiscus sabdariffa TaxID=183260 RepID=A0ABR2NIX4_9ROSI